MKTTIFFSVGFFLQWMCFISSDCISWSNFFIFVLQIKLLYIFVSIASKTQFHVLNGAIRVLFVCNSTWLLLGVVFLSRAMFYKQVVSKHKYQIPLNSLLWILLRCFVLEFCSLFVRCISTSIQTWRDCNMAMRPRNYHKSTKKEF